MQEKVSFDVWCLVNADFRQIAKRVLIGNRRDLTSAEVVSQLNDHINADTPMLLAQAKKLRYWNSLIGNMPPWAREVYLYVHGLTPADKGISKCDTHQVHHNGVCPLCQQA